MGSPLQFQILAALLRSTNLNCFPATNMFDLIVTILLLSIGIISFKIINNSRYTHAPNVPIMINRRGGARIPFRRNPLIPPPNEHQEPQPPTPTHSYEARPEDVIQVKGILSKTRNLPPEIVDMILDRAEYWACSIASIDYTNNPRNNISIAGSRPGEDQFLVSELIRLRNYLLPIIPSTNTRL